MWFRNLICSFSQRSLWIIISSIYLLIFFFVCPGSCKWTGGSAHWASASSRIRFAPDWIDFLQVWLMTYFYEQSLLRSVDVIVRSICIVNISTIICPLNFRMKEMFFEDDIDDSKYCGHLYGLGTNFVVGSNNNNSSMSKTFSLNILLF